jgi:hypothetical protein
MDSEDQWKHPEKIQCGVTYSERIYKSDILICTNSYDYQLPIRTTSLITNTRDSINWTVWDKVRPSENLPVETMEEL